MGSSRILIAGLSGDSGKTIVSLSTLMGLRERGLSVSAFKKGPDYIDPAWLSTVTERPCRSLDTYLVDRDRVFQSFLTHAEQSDVSVIEGNRGLFDGKDALGTHSSAELAKLLEAPVVLVVDATKSTRTIAALVKGCIDFDPDLRVAGVILNRFAGKRHLEILRDSIRRYTGLPLLGAIPKQGVDSGLIPGRHLGLVTPREYAPKAALLSRLRQIAADFLDIDGILQVARSAGPLWYDPAEPISAGPKRFKIGYFSDPVFTFYYPENLEALEANGARLVPVSSLDDSELPEIDALYIGGGFPETHAAQLARNRSMMQSVRKEALDGLPVYAECGGLVYLARSLRCDDVVYPMSGLFPIDLSMHSKPVGHGYTVLRVDEPNPFYAVGTSIRGHEFHYSGVESGAQSCTSCMKVESGVGVGGTRDGLVSGNTLACYTHVHASGTRDWALAMACRAAARASRRQARAAPENSTTGWLESEAI